MYNRIDIHAHVNFAAFAANRDEVITRALQGGTAMINIGSQYETSKLAVELTEKYGSGVYAIVGLHPIHSGTSSAVSRSREQSPEERSERGRAVPDRSDTVFEVEKYRELLTHPKVVGIGECGLDYYRMNPDSAAKQKEVFLAQINLANETKKPLMLHIRQAYSDVLDILPTNAKVGGDVHFFAGSLEEARRFLDLGFTISFTGVITFTKNYDELVRFVPLDMIQAETDCPFVTPIPHRGERNEPIFVLEVIKKIAEIKKIPLEKVEEALLANAKRVWGVACSR
ncbi:MAG: TatD family hydrolase [Patescibacteria group bacterium]